MSTAIDLTFNCNTCNGDIAAPDIREHNRMQWRCPNCGDWSNWMKLTNPAPITPQGNEGPFKPWDLRDEDGDVHSPAWYLEAFITARETYMETREKVANCNDDSFDGQLDDAYYELELYGTYINRLFGSDLVEGEWNASADEDE